jgi:hypothetical protein
MKNILFYFLIIFCFASCIDTSFEDSYIPFSTQNITFGYIDSTYGARVFVGKNASPFVKDSNIVNNSNVSLWSEGQLVAQLLPIGQNIFATPKTFQPNLFKTYYFKAISPLSGDTMIAKATAIPTVATIENVSAAFTNQRQNVAINFTITNPNIASGYTVFYQLFSNDTLIKNDIKTDPTFIPYRGTLVSSKNTELDGTLKIKVEIGNPYIYDEKNKRIIEANKARIYVYALTKESFQSIQSFNSYEPSSGEPFFEPNILPNTLNTGYGFLGAYSTKVVEVILK